MQSGQLMDAVGTSRTTMPCRTRVCLERWWLYASQRDVATPIKTPPMPPSGVSATTALRSGDSIMGDLIRWTYRRKHPVSPVPYGCPSIEMIVDAFAETRDVMTSTLEEEETNAFTTARAQAEGF